MNIAGNDQENILNGTNGDDYIEGFGGADILRGFKGDDVLIGGDGDDVLFGGAGNNTLLGGLGDDTFILKGTFDYVSAGLGRDLIDLEDFETGEGFLTVDLFESAGAVVVLIDGDENFGLIRQIDGFDAGDVAAQVSFRSLNNALQLVDGKPEGGMQVFGTISSDMFLVDAGENGWIGIRPGLGYDTIKIQGDSGFVRLDYIDQSQGVFANLKFGFVSMDVFEPTGFGNKLRIYTDQITGEGHVAEFRATVHDDVVYGSKHDERFILNQGNDFLAGGRGDDMVRYDRSGVDEVVVDLGKGLATGTWSGNAFSHTLRSIEDVRGSRDDNDTLLGSWKDNQIDGRGGNDKIIGKGGDDILIGGTGADRFIFRNNDGNDVIVDFNAANNREKINLNKVSAITSFTDLVANHMTDFTDGSIKQTYISDGAGLNITLEGLLIADLDSGDFLF